MDKKVLIVIPAYNEAMNIVSTMEDIRKHASCYDYVIVNDGSLDNTLDIIRKHDYNCIDSIVNLGLFGAVQTGFRYAYENGYDIAIQFDGDGQHKAEVLPKLVEAMNEGVNIVIGSRFVKAKKPFTARMIGSRLIAAAIWMVTGKKISDPTSGLRAYDREALKEYAYGTNNPPEPDTLVFMLRKGKRIKEVQATMRERIHGESYLNLSNTVKYMSRVLLSIFLIQPFRRR